MDIFSITDLFKDRPRVFSIEDFASQGSTIFPVGDLDIASRFRTTPEGQRLYEEVEGDDNIFSILEQFGRGALREATFGLSKYVIEPEEPDTTAERIARGAGQFAGFLVPLLTVGGAVGKAAGAFGTRAIPGLVRAIAPRAAEKTMLAAGRIGGYFIRSATSLGAAEAVSDITDLAGMPERFVSGATIGSIFGGSHLVHIGKSKLIQNIARQFLGRGMMAAAGRYNPDMLTQENIPELVFGEILNTFFLSKGVRAKDIINGNLSPDQERLVNIVSEEMDSIKRGVNMELPMESKKFKGVYEMIAQLGEGKVTPAAINLAKYIKDFSYDTVNKVMKPMRESDSAMLNPEPFDIRYKLTDKGVVEVKRGANAQFLPNTTLAELKVTATEMINNMVRFPNKRVGKPTKDWLNTELNKIKTLPASDYETFMKLLGLNPAKFKYSDLMDVTEPMRMMAENPQNAGKLLGVMFKRVAGEADHEFKNQELFKLADRESNLISKAMASRVLNLRHDIITGKKGGSPLTHLLRFNYIRSWWDVRKIMNHLERSTGLPFAYARKSLAFAEGFRDKELYNVMKPLEKYKLTKAEERMAETYYNERFKARDAIAINEEGKEVTRPEAEVQAVQKQLYEALPEMMRGFVDTADGIMETMSPYVKKYRFLAWLEGYRKFKAGERKTPLPIFRNQKEIEKDLLEGRDLMNTPGFGDAELDKWLDGRDWGVIEKGNYLPSIFVGKGKIQLENFGEFRDYIDFLGTGPTKIRSNVMEMKVDDVLMDEYLNRPLTVRIHNYGRTVLNLKYMDKPLKFLGELANAVDKHLQQASRQGLLTTTADRKARSLLDYLQLYAHRKKGYPVKVGEIGRLAKVAQSAFFRTLVVRPFLWLRNLFQAYVTPPDKAILNPRWSALAPGKGFKHIPENIKDMFDSQVNQFESFVKHHMYLEETDRLKKGPLGGLFKVAERVGKIYPLTDLVNRRSVFSKTYWRTKHYTDQFQAGKINEKQLYNKLKLDKLDPLERIEAIELIDKGVMEDVGFFMGKWMTDNSQWIYKRGEKSLAEMTGEGESFTNLLTWAKGITQRLLDTGARFQEGWQRKDYRMMGHSVTEIAGLGLASVVANTALQHIGFKHGSKFADYGADMFFWEVGGVSIDIVKQAGEVFGGLITSVDGTPAERKQALEAAMKYVDSTVARQLIPFMKNALSLVESVTGRSYISPLYNALSNKGMGKVDRDLVERFTHAVFATDPSKSKDVYKHITEQEVKYASLARDTTNPAKKAFYAAKYERYKYLSSIFDRYQPLQVAGYFDTMERDEWMKKYDYRVMLAEQRRQMAQKKRKWGM